MFNNNNLKMATNLPTEQDESIRVPGLDMTRGSLQDILDDDAGNSMDVDGNLPQVPLNSTNPFHNITIGNVTGRGGPLSGLRIADADIIIEGLNKQLADAVAKNDNETELLQRMDSHRRNIEAELARLKVESEQLKKEKEDAVREKRDYTINQDRLREKIRSELEQEFVEKEQNLISQLKIDMRAKIESKVSSICTQYQQEYKEELGKLKTEWSQERKRANDQHQAQIDQILKDVETLKNQSQACQAKSEPGDKLRGLKSEAFNFVPGTINTKRGAAVNLQDDTIMWSKPEGDVPPVPPRKSVHFTSTPRPPASKNLFDVNEEVKSEPLSNTNPFVGNIADIQPIPITHQDNPFIDDAPCKNPTHNTAGTEATSFINNTMTAVASEFRKMREPKLAKLKGGTTANASLFFNSWVKDVRAIIAERSMTNYESLQLVKDYSEGKARAQVEFYLVSTNNPTFEGLIQDLAKSFKSGEDEATIKKDFYSRTQLAKESVDDFADMLQLLARKILNVDPSFQNLLNKSLCQQLANGLKDPSHGISARQILKQQPEISFVVFRSDLANILGCRARGVGAKGALSSAVTAESPEAPVPAKRRRTNEDDSIATQINMCIKDNQELHRKLDALDPAKMVEAVTNAVAGSYQKGYRSSNPFTKSTNPFQAANQSQASTSSQYSRPYLGQPREPQLTPGADGNLNPALSCKYCKDTGHEVGNCAKVKRKEALKAAAAAQSAPKPKGN